MKDMILSHAAEVTDLQCRVDSALRLIGLLGLESYASQLAYQGSLAVNYLRNLTPDPLRRTPGEIQTLQELESQFYQTYQELPNRLKIRYSE